MYVIIKAQNGRNEKYVNIFRTFNFMICKIIIKAQQQQYPQIL